MSGSDLAWGDVGLPYERTTFSSQTTKVLRNLILEGHLASGERLNEVELAVRLGISRGPLREALHRLAAEGLITIVSHRGSFVRSFTVDDLQQLYEAREILEVSAARLAAVRRSDQEVAALEEMLRQSARSLDSGNASDPFEKDFHVALVSATRNEVLTDHVVELLGQLRLARARSGHHPARTRAAYEEHVDIARAVIDGDAETAAARMAEHLQRSFGSARRAMGVNATPSR